ncbi:MAG: YIP1 family protein [Eubacteriales bacterium]
MSDIDQNNQFGPDVVAQEALAPAKVAGAKDDNRTGRAGLAELIYGVIFTPRVTFRKFTEDPPLFQGFVVFLLVVILTSLMNTLVPPDFSKGSAELAGALAKTRPYIGIIGALLAFIGWFMQAGVFHLFAELLGGRGRAVGVLTVLAFADIPRVLVIPFQVISVILVDSLFGRFLTVAVSLLAFVWWAVLLVIGLREIQGFSTGRAVAALLIPFGILGLVIIVLTAAIVGFIAPFMGGAYQGF